MCVPTRVRYSRGSLHQLRPGCGLPPSQVVTRLKGAGVLHYRGRRAGRNCERNIEIVNSSRIGRTSVPAKQEPKVIEIPRQWYDLPSFMLSNVTSLCNKVDELDATIKSLKVSAVAITEAWQITPEICSIEGYTLHHYLRSGRRGGGVVLYSRSELSASQLPVSIPEGVEALWVRLTPPSHPRDIASLIVCVIYHPPRAPTADVLVEHIITTADSLRARYPCAKLVLCGDFNELNTAEIQEQLHVSQLVEFPTHGNNTLDLILSDVGDYYLPPTPLPPVGRSAHISVLLRPAATSSHQRSTTIRTHRPTPDSRVREFGQWITQHPWTEVLSAEGVQEKWDSFLGTITEAYHIHFPLKQARFHPADAPWLTPRIKRLIQQRSRAFYTDTVLFRQLRNKVIREIRRAKEMYYPSKIQHLRQNTSQWYNSVKGLCGLNKTSGIPLLSHLPADIAAEQINDHFASVCQTLPEINPSLLPAYLPSLPPPTVQTFQVAKKLSSLKPKRSSTPVDLPIKLYREFAPELSIPISSIINSSLTESKSPTDWKTSFVTPIPKSSNPQSLNDLRPIAITPIPSLICEDFIFEWAYSEISNLIDPRQFGNVKTSSTTHYLVSFLDFIYKNLEQRKTSVVVVFVDFRKAFDLVDATTIISKALHLGLSPSLVAWLADFLTGRRQVVRYQGGVSSAQYLTCGVPQGTKMGPLCFLILINDALKGTPHRWKYVDDCTVGISVNNTALDYTPLQETLDRLHTWTVQNKVTINHNKTVVMHFHTSGDHLAPPQLTVGSQPLQVVQTTKLLGITIDSKLTWKDNTTNIVRSASYRLYMLRRLRSLGARAEDLLTIYKSFILPKLMYASPAWTSSLTITQQRHLEKVQKRACRTILGSAYTSYQDALTTLNLPSLAQHHQEALKSFALDLVQHPRHRDLLPPPAPPPGRAVRHHNTIMPIRARTDRYKKSPIPTLVNIINNK